MLRGLVPILDKTAGVWIGGVRKKDAMCLCITGVVGATSVVFYLTDNGLVGGNALFPNNVYLDTLMLRAVEGTNPHAFGTPVLSNGNKTLTVSVSKTGAVIDLLGINVLRASVPATGSTICGTVWGD